MPDGFVWETAPEEAFEATFTGYAAYVRDQVYQLCLRRAPEIETWMKQNAPWTDRTGNARQALYTFVEQMQEAVVVNLSHGQGIYYGLFLETRNAGRFSILAPAIDYWGPIIMQDLVALLGQ